MEAEHRPDDEAIARRAYEISQRADGGEPAENWARAEQELRDEAWAASNTPAATPAE